MGLLSMSLGLPSTQIRRILRSNYPMEEESVNLLKDERSEQPAAVRPFFLFHRKFLTVVIVVATIGVFFSVGGSTSDESGLGKPSFFATLRSIVTAGDRGLSGEDDGRINFLLFGHGGTGHDGPELTDTIIFASVHPDEGKVGMLSIPRDLNVPIDGYGWRKINHVNAYAEQDHPGEGAKFAAASVGKTLDQPIHYYLKVDFRGFEKFIDDIGGIDVHVDREFFDPAYPLDDGDGTVEEITFEEGWQEMDGATALKFARSRHGNNGEGSDFARAARQQKILLAVKKKILSASTLLNPSRINRVISTLTTHIETNLNAWEIVRIAKMAGKFDKDRINNLVLDTRPGGPLYETNINGSYVILPKNDDWRPVQQLAENVFDAKDIFASPLAQDPKAPAVKVEIQNGTSVTGLAFETAQLLESQGFNIAQIGNAGNKGIEKTIIYDLSDGGFTKELEAVRDYLDAEVQIATPGWIFTNDIIPDMLTVTNAVAKSQSTDKTVDFLIILGQSSVQTKSS